MTELLLIRHGETDYNRQMRFQGHVDVPLNDNGLAQAERLAERLADEPIDFVMTSDLQRARQTAAPLLGRRSLPGRTDPMWREQAFGLFEGLDAPTIRMRHPELWADWIRHEADLAPPGGETVRQFHARVWQALQSLAESHAGCRIAVVTHGGVLDMVWRGVNSLPLTGARSCSIPNSGLNRLHWQSGTLTIVNWADDAHLAGMSIPPVVIPLPSSA